MPQVSGSFQQTGYSRRTLPILSIKFTVQKPNGKDVEFNDEFWVDSGFPGFLKMPQNFTVKLKRMGVRFVDKNMTIASGPTSVEACSVVIDRIELNSKNILPKKVVSVLICNGTPDTPSLVGLGALEKWKICLDLPKEVLTID